MSIEIAITEKRNEEALAFFITNIKPPLTKGKIRSLLSHKKVYWFGCKDSFRKNNSNWDNHIDFFNGLILNNSN